MSWRSNHYIILVEKHKENRLFARPKNRGIILWEILNEVQCEVMAYINLKNDRPVRVITTQNHKACISGRLLALEEGPSLCAYLHSNVLCPGV